MPRDRFVLTDKQRQKVISKLPKMSDNEIAEKCGVSRSTVWRIRQDVTAQEMKRKRAAARMKAKEKKASEVVPRESRIRPPAAVPVAPLEPSNVVPVHEVVPKVDVEPVALVHYFAVQVLRGESVRDVVAAVMKAAEAEGLLFRKLQTLDCISVGTMPFARFRSDLAELPVGLGTQRGVIAFVDGSYRVSFTDGRHVKYPTTVMCSVQKAGFGVMFAGTRIARWAQQFTPTN